MPPRRGFVVGLNGVLRGSGIARQNTNHHLVGEHLHGPPRSMHATELLWNVPSRNCSKQSSPDLMTELMVRCTAAEQRSSACEPTPTNLCNRPPGRPGQHSLMPRYYFDLRDGELVVLDPEGMVFGTLGLARREAKRALHEMAGDDPDVDHSELSIDIREGVVVTVTSTTTVVPLPARRSNSTR